VAFEALDNGVKSCASPKLMQRLCDEPERVNDFETAQCLI
jgi:hypothetical protein